MSDSEKISSVIKKIPAKATWPIRQLILWPDKPLSYIKLPNDHKGLHFGLYLKKDLVAVSSLFINGAEAQFRKLATISQEQGKGYGTELLSYLMAYCKGLGLERIWCNARADKQNFYLKRGFTPTTETFSKGGIVYVIMEKRYLPLS